MGKPDGSHDDLADMHTANHPRTQAWMEDVLTPLFEACTEEERIEIMLEVAELLEDDLKEHDPENPLLDMLADHRRKEQGFE